MVISTGLTAYSALGERERSLIQGVSFGLALRSPAFRASAVGVARQTALAAVRIPAAAITPFVPALTTAALFAAAAALGATAGAVAGVLISEQLFGEQGRRDSLRLYTGQVSPSEYVSTLKRGFLG